MDMLEKQLQIPDYAHSPDEALARKRAQYQRQIQKAFLITKIAIGIGVIALILKFFWPSKVEQLSDADAQQLLSMISPNLGNPDKIIVILSRDDHEDRESGLAVYCEYPTPPATFPTDPMKVEECQVWFTRQIELNKVYSSNTIELPPPPDNSLGPSQKRPPSPAPAPSAAIASGLPFNGKTI